MRISTPGRRNGEHSLLLRDRVYSKIKSDILSCNLQPGSKLHEQELAGKYGVSKSPVRDALLRLQSDGFVEVAPRKGYFVSSISMVDALELYEMRQLLERACIERAARAASDTDIRALDKFRRGPPSKNGLAWLRYNRDFHLAIAACCGNRRLQQASERVIHSFDRLTYAGVQQGQSLEEILAEHSSLIDAIQMRNGPGASQLMRLHIENSRNHFLNGFATSRLKDS
jgi:GntR family transcriptional regulator, rspAB operon transcriptional repressor